MRSHSHSRGITMDTICVNKSCWICDSRRTVELRASANADAGTQCYTKTCGKNVEVTHDWFGGTGKLHKKDWLLFLGYVPCIAFVQNRDKKYKTGK